MKKIFIAFMVVVLLVGTFFSATASAITVNDVFTEFKTIPASRWIADDIAELMKTIPVSDEQAGLIMPYVDELKVLFPVDLGGSGHDYSSEQLKRAMEILDAVCEILSITYVMEDVEDSHEADVLFKFYDANGKLIYTFDGDAASPTGEVAVPASKLPLYAGFVVLVFAAVSAFIASKKFKSSSRRVVAAA